MRYLILSLVFIVYAESDHDRIVRLETEVKNVIKTLDEHEGYISADMTHKRENYKKHEVAIARYNQTNTKQDMGEIKDMITWIIQAIMVTFGGGYLVQQRRKNGSG